MANAKDIVCPVEACKAAIGQQCKLVDMGKNPMVGRFHLSRVRAVGLQTLNDNLVKKRSSLMNFDILESGSPFYDSGHIHLNDKCFYEKLPIEEAHKKHGELCRKHSMWCDLMQDLDGVKGRLRYIQSAPVNNHAGTVEEAQEEIKSLEKQIEAIETWSKLQEFIVVVSGQSMSDMGAARYWEIHVKALSEEDAMEKAQEYAKNWSIFGTSWGILDDPRRAAPKGAICYVEVP